MTIVRYSKKETNRPDTSERNRHTVPYLKEAYTYTINEARVLFLFTVHLKKMVSMAAGNVRVFSKELMNLQRFAHPIRSLSSP